MRVLLVAPHEFYVDRGSPIDVDILVRALSARGDTVDLVVYQAGEDRQYPGVTIHRARPVLWPHRVGPGFSIAKIVADAWLFLKAYGLIRRTRYDIVHAAEEAVFFARWIKAVHGVPYIYDMDSSIAQKMVEEMPWLRPLSSFFNWCEARAIRGALATAPVCNALADLAHARGARHVATLHDISQITPEALAPTQSLRDTLGLRDLILMYVGNLEPYQGVDLLLEALAKVRQAGERIDLIIAGGSPAHIRKYRKMAERLRIDDCAHFIGPWPAAKLAELLSEADILAAPRLRGINTPAKIFPYLHSGRAVIATDLLTHTQILDASVCRLAAATPDGFAAAIIELIHDPEGRRAFGEAGRRFVERDHLFPAHQRRVNGLYEYIARELESASLERMEPSSTAAGGAPVRFTVLGV